MGRRNVLATVVASMLILQIASFNMTPEAAYAENEISVEWVKTWGGVSFEAGEQLATDSSDNLYVVGTTQSFGSGNSDILILKYDRNGTLLWSRTWGTPNLDSPHEVLVDPSGYVYVLGITFRPPPNENFILKFDSDGNLIWQRAINDAILSITAATVDTNGDIYITGASLSGLLLLKFDSIGDIVWMKAFSSNGFTVGFDIELDSQGNIHVAGRIENTESSKVTILVSKFDSSGNIIWARSWGNVNIHDLALLVIDGSGNIYMGGGTFAYNIRRSPCCLEDDVLLLKFDQDGNLIFSKVWGTALQDRIRSLTLSRNGDLMATGYTGTSDVLILKIDSSGNIVSANAWGGLASGYDITVDASGNTYIAGNTAAYSGTLGTITEALEDSPSATTEAQTLESFSVNISFSDIFGQTFTPVGSESGAGGSDSLLIKLGLGQSTKQPSIIDISVNRSSIELGHSVIVSSTISPFHVAQVTLTYTKPDLTTEVRQAVLGDNGAYVDMFVPDVTGQWRVQASWEGDEDHLGASSSIISFEVITVERKLEIEVNQFTAKGAKVYFTFDVDLGSATESSTVPAQKHAIKTNAGEHFVGPVYITQNSLNFPISVSIKAFNKSGKLLGSEEISIQQNSNLPRSFTNIDKKKIDFNGWIRVLDSDPVNIPQEPPTNDCKPNQPPFTGCEVSVLDQWNWFQINADDIWEQYSAGSLSLDPIIVAVLDTGVDYNHEDLKANMWTNLGENGTDSRGRDKRTNGIDDDKNGYKDDYYGVDCTMLKFVISGKCLNDQDGPLDDAEDGHGTGVAGVIAGSINNTIGIAGIAPNVQIMAIKVLGKDGLVDGITGPAKITAGINYAVKMGAKVINLSLKTNVDDENVKNAIERATKKGIIVVAAAGNDMTSNPKFPASYEDVITVSALSRLDRNKATIAGDILYLNSFSNYGNHIDVSAPGFGIRTTGLNGNFVETGDTSIAAPHVSAAAALVQGYYHSKTGNYLTPQQVREIILKSSNDLGPLGWDPYYGTGYPDLRKALEEVNALI